MRISKQEDVSKGEEEAQVVLEIKKSEKSDGELRRRERNTRKWGAREILVHH